jgi:hypothetical protein
MIQSRFGKKLKLPSVFQIKYQLVTMWLADQRKREAEEVVDSAAQYRRRADALAAAMRRRSPVQKHRLIKKQAALNAMADNEDWLNGKPGAAIANKTGSLCPSASPARRVRRRQEARDQ